MELPTVEGKKFHFDLSGLIFFIVTLMALNLFITIGKDAGWTNFLTLGSIAIAALAFAFFYMIEKKKVNKAFIDFSLFKNKNFSAATVSIFF